MYNKGFYISPSKINTFYMCPYQYWAKYIAHLQAIPTPVGPMMFGSTIHDIIVQYYDKVDNETHLSEAVEKIEETFTENSNCYTTSHPKITKRCQRNFAKFENERIESKKTKPILLEKKLFADLFPEIPRIGGIVDAYMEDGACIDWKTGRHEEMDDARMTQGKVYEMLLEDNGYPVKKVVFNNLRRGMQLELPKITNGWLETRIRYMVSQIKRGRFPTQESGLCDGWCGYVLSCNTRYKCPWSGHVV